MLKQIIEKYINQEKNQIFNFGPLNECLNNLPSTNYQIIPFNAEKIKGYERIDIKYKNSTISSVCIEFIASSPNIELVFIKKYNDKNIMQEEINFMHQKKQESIDKNNCIINYILKENDDNIDILKNEYYYKNDELIGSDTDEITITKDNFKKYYDELLISLSPTDKEVNYLYTKEELLELEQKAVTLSRIYSYAREQQKRKFKKKQIV